MKQFTEPELIVKMMMPRDILTASSEEATDPTTENSDIKMPEIDDWDD